jgi:putative endonuclease
MPFTYILYSLALDRYYIGSTSGSVEDRLKKHLARHDGFTAKANDWRVVYKEEYLTENETLKRERQIKSWKSRRMIEQLASLP